jgi:hypothetical protein
MKNDTTRKGRIMSLKDIETSEVFYGNGIVYLATPKEVVALDEYNFDIESLRKDSWGEYWVNREVVVALGCWCPPKKAIRALQKVIRALKDQVSSDE